MPDPKRDGPNWMQYSGIGVEFSAAVAGFALFGFWIDRHYGSRPWGLVIGAALGLIGGTYNLIKKSMKAFEPPDSAEHADSEKGKDGDETPRGS